MVYWGDEFLWKSEEKEVEKVREGFFEKGRGPFTFVSFLLAFVDQRTYDSLDSWH